MRCDECVLERESATAAPSIETFLEKLAVCTECPLRKAAPTEELVRVLIDRHREAARLVRKLSSKVRQQEVELEELAIEMEKYEARVGKLENLHRSSTRELLDQVDLAQRQEAALRAMSTPIIRVWQGVLALPVIGKLDSERAELMLGSLLLEIELQGSSHAIIDLTGVGEIDEATADHLLRITRAAEFLGAQVVLTGMRGKVAQRLVDLGADLAEVATMGDVEDALRRCISERRG
jgi:rsbT co-antagonist protein RsbR